MPEDDAPKITGANDMKLVVGGRSTNATSYALVVSDFEFQEQQDKPLEHGIGNEEPQGRHYSNKEYTFSFTLRGEDAELFDQHASDDMDIKAVLTGRAYKWIIRHLDYTQFTFSGSDGDVVEFSSDLNALSYETERV